MSTVNNQNLNWFESLYGFNEFDSNGNNVVKSLMRIENDKLISNVNNRSFQIGTNTTPSLLELRELANRKKSNKVGKMEYKHICTGGIFKWVS